MDPAEIDAALGDKVEMQELSTPAQLASQLEATDLDS